MPRRGAVNKPRGFQIQAPFPCGVKVRVSCGYGPSCSGAHRRTRAQNSTNDYHALDMNRASRDRGFDQPVVAVAPGVVRLAGWTKRGWAPYGKAVYIEHDYRDARGGRYYTLYAHLRRVKVEVGQQVDAGTVLGTLGGSSRHTLLRFGAHLHFAMYRNAKRTLGGGRAVVPEPMGRQEDLRGRMRWTACQDTPRPLASAEPPSDEPRGRKRAAGGLADPPSPAVRQKK